MELLFAVAIMGIGFIMIAAIFPIGLSQTKLTLDETAGAADSRAMSARLQQIAQGLVPYDVAGNTASVFPTTYEAYGATGMAGTRYNGQVRTLNDPRDFADFKAIAGMTALNAADANVRRYGMWQSFANDIINTSDPRKASVVLYKRDASVPVGSSQFVGDATAQVVVLNSSVANTSTYQSGDVAVSGTIATPPAPKQAIFNLEARPVGVQIVYDPTNQNYVVSFFSVKDLDGTGVLARGGYPTGTTPSGNAWNDVLDSAVNAVAEGCFIVISDDRVKTVNMVGRMNGRIFRVGQRRTDLGGLTYDLAPGYTFSPDPGLDGVLNAALTSSGDDFTAIGADKSANGKLISNITYASPANVVNPRGANTPDGTTVLLQGTADKQGAVALVLGRGFSNPVFTPPGIVGNVTTYTGPAQDVSIYTTFVTVPNR